MTFRAQNNDGVPHLLALGGGYATFYAYRELASWIRQGRLRMTVIDRNNYHCFHGLVPEMIAGKIQPTTVLSSLRRMFRYAHFCNGEIVDVDLESRRVKFSRSLDGKEFQLNYDHLLVGFGSTDDLKRFPGLAPHTLRVKTYQDILLVKNHLLTMLELAEIEKDPVELERLLSVVVAGGNYAGIEIASEIADILPAIASSRFPNVPLEKMRVSVVHSGRGILPELSIEHPALQAYAQQTVEENPHIRLKLGTRLASATAEEAVLSDGERIPTRTIINCTGTAASPLLEFFPVKKDQSGRVMTNEFCQVPGLTNVWAAGDCAAVPHPAGGSIPPLAIWAMMAGRQIGKNLRASLSGGPLRPFRFTGLGDACTLGKSRAAAQLKGIPLRGLAGYLAWRFFMVVYLPAPEKKVRVVLDWILSAIFGSDLINTNVHRPLGVTPMLFEPGQDIVREGEVGQSLYMIRSGQVEVIRRTLDDSAPQRLAVLGQGQHFGEVSVFQRVRRTATVRALTRVELLSIRGEAALALSQTSNEIGQALRSLPTAFSNPTK